MSRTLLFVVNVDWFFLSHRLAIAQGAMREGYSVHIATGLTDRQAELERFGLVVHPLALSRRGAGLANAMHTALQLWRLFRSVQPDVVHLVTIKPVLLGGIVARLSGVRGVVAAVSGLGFVFTAQGARALLRRWVVGSLYRLALGARNVKVIFQNPDDLRTLSRVAGLPATKLTMIRGSGVELQRFAATPLPPGIPVVLMASRLLGDKGVREFVLAAELLKRRGIEARFALVGTIDPANPTSLAQAELDALAAAGLVEQWGHRADMPEALAAASIVVLPSYREGLPKVLLEAAAAGRAVVTTDVPGCRDAIEPSITGLLVPVRNADALADAIAELLADRARCQRMGDAGRQLAERAFDVKQVVSTHLKIYRELIANS